MLTILLPEGNRKDLDDIPAEVKEVVSFIFVASAAEGIAALFPKGAIGPKRTKATPKTKPRKPAVGKKH
jgi:ATP-dependent Lon protease